MSTDTYTTVGEARLVRDNLASRLTDARFLVDSLRALHRQSHTTLALALDAEAAAQEGRTTCGFTLGSVNGKPTQPECDKLLGHMDDHYRSFGPNKGGSIHSHGWDENWVRYMETGSAWTIVEGGLT